MVNRPPFDRDPPPPPGGFDPRFGADPRSGPDPRFADEPRFGGGPRYEGEPRFSRDPRDPYAQGPDPFDRRTAPPPPPPRRGMARSTMLLLGLGLLLLIGAIAFALSLSRSGPGSDRLGEDGKAGNETATADPEARCAAPATYDRIKRELFRQAAATRGSDLAAFDRLSAYAAIRVQNPVLREEDEGLERVSCAGEVSLDLPPGVQVVGGRRTLTANLGYSLQPAADSSGDVVTLTGAEPITAPLATLARIGGNPASAGQQAPLPAPVPAADDPEVPAGPSAAVPPPPQAAPPAPRPPEPAPPPRQEPQTSARPSFNCANARTAGERAVCGDAGLASLDRQMASRYFGALREANPTQRVLLERTRSRFLSFRDRCGSDSCIAGAYRDRIREINDIMADRWVAPR